MEESSTEGAHLLVGVDFSESSGCALDEAHRLRSLWGVRISVVHVLTRPSRWPWLPDQEAIEWLDAHSIEAEEIGTRAGRPWSELARAAEEQRVTAIVIGSHGISGYQPLALGSTAMRLTLLSPCPVIVVGPAQRRRRPAAARPTEGVLYPR